LINYNIVVPSGTAQNHLLIREFVALVNATAPDGALSFSDTQTRPFMKFWSNLIISEYLKNENDFLCRFLGTTLVKNYGADHTGKLMSERGTKEAQEFLMQLNLDALKGEGLIYASGNVFWETKTNKRWHQVRTGLKYGKIIDATLGFVVFE
jgi:hypothetical protein